MTIEIPKNIEEYLNLVNKSAIDISINRTDGINGYGRTLIKVVELKLRERKCWNCGVSDIFSTQQEWDESPCIRHRYNEEYTTVFAWREHRIPERGKSLEECFDDWLNLQSTDGKFTFKYYDEPSKEGEF